MAENPHTGTKEQMESALRNKTFRWKTGSGAYKSEAVWLLTVSRGE